MAGLAPIIPSTSERLLMVDAIAWESHGHKRLSQGFVGEQPVATICKHKNHTLTNNGIYSVEVLGTELPVRYRGIGEARVAAQMEYEDWQNGTRG